MLNVKHSEIIERYREESKKKKIILFKDDITSAHKITVLS